MENFVRVIIVGKNGDYELSTDRYKEQNILLI
jgi:hypothetical protein